MKSTIKHALCLLLSIILCFSVVGCKKSKIDNNSLSDDFAYQYTEEEDNHSSNTSTNSSNSSVPKNNPTVSKNNSTNSSNIFIDPGTIGINGSESDKIEVEFMKNEYIFDTFGGISKWKKSTEWDSKINERILSILNTKNPAIPSGKTVYYVSPNGDDSNEGTIESPWKTIKKVNSSALPDSIVCFERGGTWRGEIIAKDGITYTAYGTGRKPNIFASPFNGGGSENASKWKQHRTNIWVIDIGNGALEYDVGTLVFNGGEAHAIKCIIRTEDDGETYNHTTSTPDNPEPFNKKVVNLQHDLHFYHDYKESKLYLYSKENPAERFKSIEFNIRKYVVTVNDNTDNVTIDNLCIKYTGGHGVGANTVKNLTVQNCEFGWIGGSIQSENIFDRNYPTRYGNAVQIWGGCDGFKVVNNYIHQVYDAGITQQYTNHNGKEYNQLNIDYSDNVIENCNYSIEYWLRADKGKIDNFKISNNYMLYAGEGFCEQRPDKSQAAHIKCWADGMCSNNMNIENNIMIGTTHEVFEICPDKKNTNGTIVLPNIYNNTVLAQKEIVVNLENYKLWDCSVNVPNKSTTAKTFTAPVYFGIITFNKWSKKPFADYIENTNDKLNSYLQGYGKASGNTFKYY